MGSQRVEYDLVTQHVPMCVHTHTHTHTHTQCKEMKIGVMKWGDKDQGVSGQEGN